MSDNPNVAEVVAFLLGEAPLEGRWFGDEENLPTVAGRPARYWWRSRLRAALEAQASAPGGEVTEWRDAFIHVSAMRYIDNGMMHDAAYEAAEQDARVTESANRAALAARAGKGE